MQPQPPTNYQQPSYPPQPPMYPPPQNMRSVSRPVRSGVKLTAIILLICGAVFGGVASVDALYISGGLLLAGIILVFFI